MHRTIADKYSLVPGVGVVVYDPASLTAMTALTVGSMAATTIGGGISAFGAVSGAKDTAAATLAGGDYARKAGDMARTAAYAKAGEQDYEAGQIEQNAGQSLAAAQRKALDTKLKTDLTMSSAVARGAASGVNAGYGSSLNNTGELAQRGSYEALMDMFNGQSTASGLRNQAAGVRYGADITRYGGDMSAYEGSERQKASRIAAAATRKQSIFTALGTLAGTAGSALSTYGKFNYPTSSGRAGASV